MGDWMQTFSGGQFWPLEPRSGEVEDRGHRACAVDAVPLCRALHPLLFGGRALGAPVSPRFSRHALWALLHDASEAICLDVIGRSSVAVRLLRSRGAGGTAAVARRFGLALPMPEEISDDRRRPLLADEALANMRPCVEPWAHRFEPLGVALRYWEPQVAERAFLERFEELDAGEPRRPWRRCLPTRSAAAKARGRRGAAAGAGRRGSRPARSVFWPAPRGHPRRVVRSLVERIERIRDRVERERLEP